jgi:adenosylhomocysteine nucleosidase
MIVVIVALEDELSRQPMPAGVVLVHSGLGKINAALAAQEAISRHRPQLVVNYGTAGAMQPRAAGLLEVNRVIQRDMDAEPLAPRGTTPFAVLPAEIHSGGQGVCCATGDSFVRSADAWLLAQHVDIVDMELYAIAAACRRAAVPWQAWKFVTDHADETAAEHWSARVSQGEPLFLQALTRVLAR